MMSCSCRSISGSQRVATITLLLASLSAGSGCALAPENCTADFRFGLTVLVRDSSTAAPAGDGAIVTAEDGAYVETLTVFPGDWDSVTFVGAGERPGRYALTVSKPGYRAWVRRGVRVGEDGCHVQRVTIEAWLQH